MEGIPCGLRLHTNGQLPPARALGPRKVEGPRQDLVALAVLFGFRQWLFDVFWCRQPQADRSRRQRDLHNRVLAGCPARGRRNPNLDFEQPALGETLFQFDLATRMDAGDQRPFPLSQDKEFTRSLDVRRSSGSHCYEKSKIFHFRFFHTYIFVSLNKNNFEILELI